jgi:1-deoxy-D-xylulose-5-phosphate synthase
MMKSASSETAKSRILDGIDSPADLKRLDETQLPQLAQEIRDELITVLSQTGGHLGPNLGVVELTIALHRVFETPMDKLVFDVSHQGYVHKLLTGRRSRFASIRQYQGLNGFLLRSESEHDCYGAGHAGTALSAALGMAVARDRRDGKEHVVVVAGDAAFTCGPSYEALNNVADHTKRFIVVLNDNEWSIAKNVGAIANYLNKIVTNDAYSHLHEKAAKFVGMIGGKFVHQLAHKVEEGVKHLLLPSVIFEELGLRYYGPIDGHDVGLLIRTFEFLKRQNEPVLLHIITQKGKGYAPAIAKPDKFHGLGKFKLETGETATASTPILKCLGRRCPSLPTTTITSWQSRQPCHQGPVCSILRPGILTGTSMLESPRNMLPFSLAGLPLRGSSRFLLFIRLSCSVLTTWLSTILRCKI